MYEASSKILETTSEQHGTNWNLKSMKKIESVVTSNLNKC